VDRIEHCRSERSKADSVDDEGSCLDPSVGCVAVPWVAETNGGRMALCRACPAGQRPYVSMTSTRPGVPVVRLPAVNEARTMGATACASFAPGNQLVVDVVIGFVDGAANTEANLNFRIQERRFTFPLSRSTLMRVR